jgi:hypothetical protein
MYCCNSTEHAYVKPVISWHSLPERTIGNTTMVLIGTSIQEEHTMFDRQVPRWRMFVIGVVIFAELAHLSWEYVNGGVVAHNILNRSDMPAISNWWGILLLPALAWFLTGRSQARIEPQASGNVALANFPLSVVVGFAGALLFGIGLAISFTFNYEDIAALFLFGMLLLAIILPVYRAECVLGFVLGMTFTFGAVLPLIVGSMIAAISITVHRLVYPSLIHGWKWFRQKWL